MVSGVYTWTIEAVRHCGFVWAGVALKPNVRNSHSLIGEPFVWMYCSDGRTVHLSRTKSGFPRFGTTGSKVTLTLNLLSDNEGNGTLSVSIDGVYPSTVFRNLRDELAGQSEGFVSAVSIRIPSRVRLRGIAKLQ